MRIYIDFDDVITETALALCGIANGLFNKNCSYNEIFDFDLQKSFYLNNLQIKELMDTAHTERVISSYCETPGAVDTITKWRKSGHEIEIVTGRPPYTSDATKRWLDERGLGNIKVIHVDKFRREPVHPGKRALTPEEFAEYKYDFAVEDSPKAFPILSRLTNCRIAVFNRPWNISVPLPSSNFTRCEGWAEIDRLLEDSL